VSLAERIDDEVPAIFCARLPVHLLNDYGAGCDRACNKGTQVVTLNAEMTMQAERNATLAGVIRQAELVIPDGSLLYSPGSTDMALSRD